jgi:hypothetical protein
MELIRLRAEHRPTRRYRTRPPSDHLLTTEVMMLTTEVMIGEIPERQSASSMGSMGHGPEGMDY